MKALALTAIWLSWASLLGAADEFAFHTVEHPASLLQPWVVETPSRFAGRYYGEYGDSDGSLQIVRYTTSGQAGSPMRYSAILVGPSAVATKPKIRVFEDLKISDGMIQAKGLLIRFCQFQEPETKKLIKGALIDGLFYEQVGG